MRIPPCGDYGDVDDDGYVTSSDAQAAARHYYGTDLFPDGELAGTEFTRADVDKDGSITMADARNIQQYADGGIGTFPVCETIPGDEDGDFPVSPTAARDAVITFSLAAVIMYVITKLIWK